MNKPFVVPVWRKWWVKSKAAWLNLLAIIAGLANWAHPFTEDLRHALGSAWFLVVMGIFGAAGFYIRHKTAGGLSLTKDGES